MEHSGVLGIAQGWTPIRNFVAPHSTQPSTHPVPPARCASASSMQSPPARADATRISILSAVLARPGARPRLTWRPDQCTETKTMGQCDRKQQPGIGHQAVTIKGDLDGVRLLRW